MNEFGEIFETRFQKSIVENTAALSYQEAQQILDNECSEEQLMTNHKLDSS